MRLAALALLLASCAGYREAWRRDGACSVVCDYRQGYLSTAYALDPWTCRCYSPQLAAYNDGRHVPLDFPWREAKCRGGCEAEAARIVSRQPWRRP